MDYLGYDPNFNLDDPFFAQYRTSGSTDVARNVSTSTPTASRDINWGAWGEFGQFALTTAAGVANTVIQLKAMERASTSESEKAEYRRQIAALEQQNATARLQASGGSGSTTKVLAIAGAAVAGVLALAVLK